MPQESEKLKFVIVIPAFNEEQFIGSCLESLLNQTLKPKEIIVVDDGSTDNTLEIVNTYSQKSNLVTGISEDTHSKANHQPGAKVVEAFKRGLNQISLRDFDVVCKFDADLEFPPNYLESLNNAFWNKTNLGLYGGVCSIFENNSWETENITNHDHVRGALKAYRIQAFKAIDGLNSQMGWDTADEFKLRFRNWQVGVNNSLQVKHLKPTATYYKNQYFRKQGEVFWALRYGFFLTCIASLKIAYQHKQLFKFLLVLKAYTKSKSNDVNYLLTKDEGKFLRGYRRRQIIKKLIS